MYGVYCDVRVLKSVQNVLFINGPSGPTGKMLDILS